MPNHIEVHAWLNTLVAWNSSVPPKDPNHVWNLHGPQTKGQANWVSYYRNKAGQKWADTLHSSYFLDPGHPDALDYTVAVYLNVVRNYDVDGIHLDFSRYDGMGFGYNPTNVARYNAVYGTTGLPAPDDPRWAQWRRDQTANLVRKIYLKAIALKAPFESILGGDYLGRRTRGRGRLGKIPGVYRCFSRLARLAGGRDHRPGHPDELF